MVSQLQNSQFSFRTNARHKPKCGGIYASFIVQYSYIELVCHTSALTENPITEVQGQTTTVCKNLYLCPKLFVCLIFQAVFEIVYSTELNSTIHQDSTLYVAIWYMMHSITMASPVREPELYNVDTK